MNKDEIMNDRVVLFGAEEVQSAGFHIKDAAARIERASETFATAVAQLAAIMEQSIQASNYLADELKAARTEMEQARPPTR